MSILLRIKFYTFIVFAVCGLGYYQTPTNDDSLVCEACPAGSTTTQTDSQAISDCGKNAPNIIPIALH